MSKMNKKSEESKRKSLRCYFGLHEFKKLNRTANGKLIGDDLEFFMNSGEQRWSKCENCPKLHSEEYFWRCFIEAD